MHLTRLILKEMGYRKLNLALALLSVVVAVGCLVAELTVLRAHDLRTEQIIAEKEEQTNKEMEKLQDEMRVSMKKLGFNIRILPKDQNLEELYAKDYASKLMPEEYVKRLVESKIVVIQHLLPSLRQKIEWPEQKGRTVILVGVRGEVPVIQRDLRNPILHPVPPGTMVVGYLLHKGLGCAIGDRLTLLGRDFTVGKLNEERGDNDDITVWVNLEEAQQVLNKEGLVNEIMALKCQCAGVGMDKVRQEIANTLPETQVIEFASRSLARFEAREAADATARREVEAMRDHRARLRAAAESFAAWLIPLVTAAATVWIGFLAFSNVRERLPEIGVLRALGLRSRDVFLLFLGKAAVIGLVGAAAGYLAGACIGLLWSSTGVAAGNLPGLLDFGLLVQLLIMAPVLSAVASLIPAMVAAQQDPALILRDA